jgi:hypothetical protein
MGRSEWDPIGGLERPAMRGLDGNYINTQGDALSRMQVVYQTEHYRQQIRAQQEAVETLRKLREEVEEPEKKDHSSNPRQIGDDMGSGRRGANEKDEPAKRTEKSQKESNEMEVIVTSHIDIRA